MAVSILVLGGLAAVTWRAESDPFPESGDNPLLNLIAFQDPTLHAAIQA